MSIKVKFIQAVILFSLSISSAWAQFVIQDIQIDGINRIDPGTVYNALPLTIGDELTESAADEAVRVLFQTGLFQDVKLEKDGSTLVIVVTERPSIAEINFNGNKQIKQEDLTDAFEQIDFVPGRIFRQETLDQVSREVKSQYFSLGRYNAQVTPIVTPSSQNRVSITLDVEEGDVAKIAEIKFVGNQVFTDSKLISQIQLREKSWTHLISKKDRYSKQKLTADLERIRSYYMDSGYLDFDITSTQVSITANKKDIFVTVSMKEGPLYTFSGFEIQGDTKEVPLVALEEAVELGVGETFSLKDINSARTLMLQELASEGYANTEITAIPEKNTEDNTVYYIFAVNPNDRVYVRRININGNKQTQDEVIRREIRQNEGGWYSSDDIDRSRTRLERLGFFEGVEVNATPVPGTEDQVDLDVDVSEKSTGNFLIGIGFSSDDGVLLRGSVSQRNLFGTGREVTLSADESDAVTEYGLTFRNPYYTTGGISRGFRLNKRDVESSENDTAEFLLDSLSAGVFYSFPLSEFNALNVGLDVVNVELDPTSQTPQEYQDFIDDHEDDTYAKLSSSVSHDTRDSILWTTNGGLLELGGSAGFGDTEYFKLNLEGAYFLPLTDDFVWRVSSSIGYGDGYSSTDELPFYENFYAGGPSTVRGYESRSLGPRFETENGRTDPLGGSRRLLVSTELLFPFPGASQKRDKRLGLFFDGGQVYAPGEGYTLGELRYSAGVALYWSSPLGPLRLSYGFPLNEDEDDEKEEFQFSIGTQF